MTQQEIEIEMNAIVAETCKNVSPGLYGAISSLIDSGQSPEMIQRYSYIRRPDITADLLIQIRMTAEHLHFEKNRGLK